MNLGDGNNGKTICVAFIAAINTNRLREKLKFRQLLVPPPNAKVLFRGKDTSHNRMQVFIFHPLSTQNTKQSNNAAAWSLNCTVRTSRVRYAISTKVFWVFLLEQGGEDPRRRQLTERWKDTQTKKRRSLHASQNSTSALTPRIM